MNSCLKTSLKALAHILSLVLVLPIFVVYQMQRSLTGKAEAILCLSGTLLQRSSAKITGFRGSKRAD